MKISVIMPVLNEEKGLFESLSSLKITPAEELIVVDGGSSDTTVTIAGEFTDKVFISGRGRGKQMNFGAGKASGEILLFLHADCILPEEGFDIIRQALSVPGVSAGAFDIRIDHERRVFRLIEFFANLRSRVASIPYGDQGIFMRREVFEKVGGFANLPLMEDIEIAGRLKKAGRIVFAKPPITTSPRRWLKEGPLYTTLRDWAIAVSYRFLRVSPEKLVKYYGDVR